jgi:hypothetical protein
MPATTTELTGVFVNGHIVPDPDARPLPDGTRVRFEVIADDDEDDLGPPMPDDSGSREEELELLRQSIADAKAGIGLVPYEQFMDELRREMGFAPLQRKERP